MSWQLIILLQTVVYAFYVLLFRQMSRAAGTAEAAAALNAVMFVIMYPFACLWARYFGHLDLSVLSKHFLVLAIDGLGFALDNIFMYKALHYLDAANVSLLGISNTILTVILAYIVLGERFTGLQFIGMVLLTVTVGYCLWLTKHQVAHIEKRQRRIWLMGLLFIALTAVTYAMASISEKYLLQQMNMASYIVVGWGSQTTMAVLVAIIWNRKGFSSLRTPKVKLQVLAGGLLRLVSGGFFVLAQVRSNNLGLVSTISNFRVILVVLLGIFLLRERTFYIRKLTAAIISVASLGILFWK